MSRHPWTPPRKANAGPSLLIKGSQYLAQCWIIDLGIVTFVYRYCLDRDYAIEPGPGESNSEGIRVNCGAGLRFDGQDTISLSAKECGATDAGLMLSGTFYGERV